MSLTAASVVPGLKIGDLLWCREGKVWWPAMITYDPKLVLYYKTTKKVVSAYHVQYFGIQATRGWIAISSTKVLDDPKEHLLPQNGLSNRRRKELKVALEEVSEAIKLDIKARKLQFIFNYSLVSEKSKSCKSEATAGKETKDSFVVGTSSENQCSKHKSQKESTKPPALTRRSTARNAFQDRHSSLATKRQLDRSTGLDDEPPLKKFAMELQPMDNGSEISVPSAILTPPSSAGEEEKSSSSSSSSSAPGQHSRKRKPARSRKKSCVSRTCTLKDGVCAICSDRDTGLLLCEGVCQLTFHLDCIGLMQAPSFKFVCDECVMASACCFMCKKPGSLYKCSRPNCSKMYHLECAERNPLFVKKNKSTSFVCPLHSCSRCTSIGAPTTVPEGLLQCVRCPLSLHRSSCLVAGCEALNSFQMVCYRHVRVDSNSKQSLYSHIHLNTCLECGETGSLFCCDFCSATYHEECLDPEDRPEGSNETWLCPNCKVHDLPTYGSMVICKIGTYRYTVCVRTYVHTYV